MNNILFIFLLKRLNLFQSFLLHQINSPADKSGHCPKYHRDPAGGPVVLAIVKTEDITVDRTWAEMGRVTK